MNYFLLIVNCLMGFFISGTLFCNVLLSIYFSKPFTKKLYTLGLIKNKKELLSKINLTVLLNLSIIIIISIIITFISLKESIFYYISLGIYLMLCIGKIGENDNNISDYLLAYKDFIIVNEQLDNKYSQFSKKISNNNTEDYAKDNNKQQDLYFRYFFEVLLNGYMEIENYNPQCIHENFDYNIIESKYNHLKSIAEDYTTQLHNESQTYLIIKLINSTKLYLDLIDKSIFLNSILIKKADGINISVNEYTNALNDMFNSRKKLEKFIEKI